MSSTSTQSHAGHGHDSPEEIRKSIKKYVMIGGVLYVLTFVTWVVSFFDFGTGPTIALGMAVATTKASLVALFFMHLIDEKKLIYYTLLLTAFMFLVCMSLPSATTHSAAGVTRQTDVRQQGMTGHGESHGGAEHKAPEMGEQPHH
jgi:cytochrome c oxidase subunit IV